MSKNKVYKLSNPYGLMATVPINDWAGGVRSLVTKAKEMGIMPSSIVLDKLIEGEETEVNLILWGDK